MKQTTIPLKPDARVTVKGSADLSVEGNDEQTLMVIVERGDYLKMWDENGIVRISAFSDCRLLLPNNVPVTVERTGGDCFIRNFSNRVVVGKIGHDLRMDAIGGASVESVGRNCQILNSSGAVEIARVGDTLTTDNIQSILAGSVGDDARLHGVSGRVEVKAGGDIKIQVQQDNKVPAIRAVAGSDIELYLPQNAACQLQLVSGGEDIYVHAAGQHVESSEHDLDLPLGNGGETVYLKSGDEIRVSDQGAPDWPKDVYNWGDQWKDFGLDIARRIEEGIRIAGDSVDYAVRKAGKASRKAERQVRHAMRGWDEWGYRPGHHVRVVGFPPEDEAPTEAAPRSETTDQERMLVLKMLQEKKITVEEAEKLLNALDR